MRISGYIFVGLFLLTACERNNTTVSNGAFSVQKTVEKAGCDFDQIQMNGELIVATLSGPDTYFEYQGRPMGLQYALIAHFAEQNGLRVRMETARDEMELLQWLKKGDVDVVCFPLSDKAISKAEVRAAGMRVDSLHHSWAVRPDAPLLKNALDQWYGSGIIVEVAAAEQNRWRSRRQVRRKVRSPYISREKGIISVYDEHFKSAARGLGWDWRLIAAISYQESGFDPLAESVAGAQGLMQIMPRTAEQLGLSSDKVFEPFDNIHAGTRYLKLLDSKLSDVQHPMERVKFVLAAYNGGLGHIRDAMALAQKHHRDSKRWDEVAPFVLQLSEARYYRDPVVKYGYMIGEETYNYVYSIWERWRQYGGKGGAMLHPTVKATEDPNAESSHARSQRRRNRFTKDTKIFRPDDPEFNQLPPSQ